MKGHTRLISDIIQLEDDRICSCSDDKTIKIWSIESGQCELTLKGHTSFVLCVMQLIDRRLCSYSYDNSVRLWNKNNGVC
jgi:WD40 repeat protein